MAKPRKPDRSELTAAVGPIIQSLTRELRDDAPGSTITRAVDILERYSVPPREAPALLYQARELLRQRHHVRRKAPYMLVILEQLARNYEPRGLKGNQNARKHGWWSRQQPLSTEEIERTVQELLMTEQYDRLRELARAVRYVTGDKLMAQTIRRLARQAERRSILKASDLYDRVRTQLGEQANVLLGDWD